MNAQPDQAPAAKPKPLLNYYPKGVVFIMDGNPVHVPPDVHVAISSEYNLANAAFSNIRSTTLAVLGPVP